ncbi:hypothetical protein FRB94_014381 [Tulasnella sp. JGI-2019a]|nr:hypothetical protein FRB93_011415 [Tulasnella sp. JGI-2019a]KAG8989451.1 hypothetical protein FRB94_014381 [Tulasnella sp. JGI-2019a]KAG9022488.1 hypothetical protein FRB95_014725 [Tulasnella sp. JGI-2019a]
MSSTATDLSTLSPSDRKRSYGEFRNIVAQRGLYFSEGAEPTDRKRNTKWVATVTVSGVTYRSDAFTQGKMEALHLAAASALRHLGAP